jgi:hypothetical protein
MIGPADDELIHRALDGALSPDEAEQFRARLVADPALGARAEHLARLAAAVDGLGAEEPPIGFSDRVMAEVASAPHPRPAWHRRLASLPAAIGHQLFPWFAHRSEQSSHSSEAFRRAGMAGGGVIVAKKALWGVAGLAVVVILAVVYFNGRTVDQGAQGAIGAADRYRGAQPGSVDAKPGNAQAFLQSDTFDKIIKNKDVRSLLGNPEVCALLANDAVEAALKDGEVEAALKDAKLMAALADADVAAALSDAGVQAFMADADVQAALADDAVEAALKSTAFEAALKDPKFQAFLGDAEIQAALKNKDGYARLFADAEAALKQANLKQANLKQAAIAGGGIEAALRNPSFAAMLADPAVEAALKGGSLTKLLADDSFQAALSRGGAAARLLTDDAFQANIKGMSRLFANDAFEAALKVSSEAALKNIGSEAYMTKADRKLKDVGGFASLFADADFQAAILRGDFRKMIGNADFEAALRNQEALQSALIKIR